MNQAPTKTKPLHKIPNKKQNHSRVNSYMNKVGLMNQAPTRKPTRKNPHKT